MLAEEFQTTVSNGKIQIPDSMRTEFEGCEVRVIVLKDNRKKKALNTNSPYADRKSKDLS